MGSDTSGSDTSGSDTSGSDTSGSDTSIQPGRFPEILRKADQVCCAVLIFSSLVAMAACWIYQGGLAGRLVDVEKAGGRPIHFQLDMNRADWPEWALLPDIGETLAKRIVESRELHGPFRDPQDLRRVHGIGPKTLEHIRPYLLPVRNSATLR